MNLIKIIISLFKTEYKTFKRNISKYNYDELIKVLRNISKIYKLRIILNTSPYHIIFDSYLKDDETGNCYVNYMCKEIKVDEVVAKNCIKGEKYCSSYVEIDNKYYYSKRIGSSFTISGPIYQNNNNN